MTRLRLSALFLRTVGGLCAGTVLCGCLSLSFGGKHEHVGIEPANAATLMQQAATTSKLEDVEARLQALEQRCGNCQPELEPEPSGETGGHGSKLTLPTVPVESP